MEDGLALLGLKYNPFEPAASGAPVSRVLWVPERWRMPLETFLDTMKHTSGPKAYTILGEYGSGKTYLLHWLEREALPSRRIKGFLFDNPGVQFYDLANSLLRRIGREELAKALWEFLNPELPGFQPSLFGQDFQRWLATVKRHKQESEAVRSLAAEIRRKDITADEEIAHKLGRMIVETGDQPYFQYRDFVAGHSSSLVAEGEEAPYFAAVLRTLRRTRNAEAVGFLLDEFEEVSVQGGLSKRQAHDYLATMKRLMSLTEKEQFWIILAMTPQAAAVTHALEPALWERFFSQGKHEFHIPPFEDQDVHGLMLHRISEARSSSFETNELFPFPVNVAEALREDVKSSPRRVVKVCSLAVARAAEDSAASGLPFSSEFLQTIQSELYPITSGQVTSEELE